MASPEIVPGSDSGAAAWAVHFASKIDTHAPALGLSAADVATLKADAAMVAWAIHTVTAMRASSQQFTAFKEALLHGQSAGKPEAAPTSPVFSPTPAAVPPGALSRSRDLAQRIKKAIGYTEAIGRDLGIIAASSSEIANDDSAKPSFRGTALAHSEARLDWMKRRHSGVVIQCKRPGDLDWITLGQDNYSPYVDGRPPVTAGTSETRQYRMRYFDKDTEVGEWSDVVSVVTIP
jgi:hypothetical protein